MASIKRNGRDFPDYIQIFSSATTNVSFARSAEQYGRSLDIDHVDIGSVGCWGEWNTACCVGAGHAV